MPQDNKHELENLLSNVMPITVYKGCVVSKIIGGYSVFGRKCKNTAEVDKVIEEAGMAIQESIVKSSETGQGCPINPMDVG